MDKLDTFTLLRYIKLSLLNGIQHFMYWSKDISIKQDIINRGGDINVNGNTWASFCSSLHPPLQEQQILDQSEFRKSRSGNQGQAGCGDRPPGIQNSFRWKFRRLCLAPVSTQVPTTPKLILLTHLQPHPPSLLMATFQKYPITFLTGEANSQKDLARRAVDPTSSRPDPLQLSGPTVSSSGA